MALPLFKYQLIEARWMKEPEVGNDEGGWWADDIGLRKVIVSRVSTYRLLHCGYAVVDRRESYS